MIRDPDSLEILERSSFFSEDSKSSTKDEYAPKASANAQIHVRFSDAPVDPLDTNRLPEPPKGKEVALNDALKRLLYAFLREVVPTLQEAKKEAEERFVAEVGGEKVVQKIPGKEEGVRSDDEEEQVREKEEKQEIEESDGQQEKQVSQLEKELEPQATEDKQERKKEDEKTEEAVIVKATETDSNGEEKEVPVAVEVLSKNDTFDDSLPSDSLIVSVGEQNATKEEKKDEYVIDVSNIDVEQLTENVEGNEEVVIDVSDVKEDTTGIPVEIRQKEESEKEDVKEEVILDLKSILEGTQSVPIRREEPEPENRPLDLKFYDYLRGISTTPKPQPPKPVSTIFTLFFTPEPKMLYPIAPREVQPIQPICKMCNRPQCACPTDFNQICNQCQMPQCVCQSTFNHIQPTQNFCSRCNMQQCICQPTFNQIQQAICNQCNSHQCSCQPNFNQICKQCYRPQCTCQPICPQCNMPQCVCNQPSVIFEPISTFCSHCNQPRCVCPANVCDVCDTTPCVCSQVTSARRCGLCGSSPCVCDGWNGRSDYMRDVFGVDVPQVVRRRRFVRRVFGMPFGF